MTAFASAKPSAVGNMNTVKQSYILAQRRAGWATRSAHDTRGDYAVNVIGMQARDKAGPICIRQHTPYIRFDHVTLRRKSRPSMAINPILIKPKPAICWGKSVSARYTAPKSVALTGIKNVTKERLVAPAEASSRK